MQTNLLTVVVLALVCSVCFADIYMHNPRGSNDRNCERNDNRQNQDRLFDSQNNAKGGYACPRAVGGPETVTPRMYYYAGSKLKLEWTAQHACGNNNNNCEVVIQYMCEDSARGLRDGTPSDMNDPAVDDLTVANANDTRQGSHEVYEYYQKCTTRTRNNGLFLADRQTQNPGALNANAPATRTRQNPNGNKSGWECPEERDYYPYWHPTPWRDIAVLTNNVSRCEMYKKESQNVIGRGECFDSTGKYLMYNNENDCLIGKGKWTIAPAWDIAAPDCQQTEFSRDNHLGNGVNGEMNSYWWTVPNHISDACVVRMRYNISTGDYDWSTDFTKNNLKSPVTQDPIKSIEYSHPLEFRINTNQYGRTFQDRSYVFSIKKRPTTVPDSVTIWNLNVRGKRGNIVQTFPAVEYDYVPQVLSVAGGDYIHFQWVGSDYNPNRNPNDAEGGPADKANANAHRADRSNIVQSSTSDMNLPRSASKVSMFVTENGQPDYSIINAFALLNQPGLNSTDPAVKCLNLTELLAKNANDRDEAKKDIQNCMKLNSAPTPYFDGGLVKMRASGRFSYFCSRNNNFSNRSQKGLIIVSGGDFSAASSVVINFAILLVAAFIALL